MRKILKIIFRGGLLLLLAPISGFVATAEAMPANPQIKFTHVTIEQGLSQNTVHCILQDRQGFLWLGTEDGLNRYDGYKVTVYKHDPEDPDSLSDNYVSALAEDSSGRLWVGTYNGLNVFDPTTGRFTRYSHDPDNPQSLSHNNIDDLLVDRTGKLWVATRRHGLNLFDPATQRVTRYRHAPENPASIPSDNLVALYADRAGALWIGTSGEGLVKFEPTTERFSQYQYAPDNPNSLSHDEVWAITQDRDGLLWLGTSNGVDVLNLDTGQFTHYRNNPDDRYSLSSNAIVDIYIDLQQNIWIGTSGGGLNMFDHAQQRFLRYQNDPGKPYSLNDNLVTSIFEDAAGVLMFGTYSGGLNTYDPQAQKFRLYQVDPNEPNSLSDNVIWSVYEEASGIVWIGTSYGGLNKFDPRTQKFLHYQHDDQNPQSLSDIRVQAIYEDRMGVLWLGTRSHGLDRFDRQTETFRHYETEKQNSESLSNNRVWSVLEDEQGTLWVGTANGLNAFDRQTERFTRYLPDPQNPNSLGHAIVYKVHRAHSGILWLGTGGGLDKFTPETGTFTHYHHDDNQLNSLSNDTVFAIYEDRAGSLWLGTWGGGLDRFDPQTETFTHYREKDGLPNNVVYGIVADRQDHLWMSTNRGIAQFDPATATFQRYNVHDGLQSDEYNLGAYYAGPSGTLFFGGIQGLNAFMPEEIRANPYIPPVVITDFQLFNTSVRPGVRSDGRTLLSSPIETTEEIVLSHEDYVLTFEFAALHYSAPERNQYAYMLEGFDPGWNQVGSRRFATYTNLPAGTYLLHVKGTNSDGIWKQTGKTLKITIRPPFWKTWWFFLLVGNGLAMLVGAFYFQQMRKLRAEQTAKLLSKEMELAQRIQMSLLPQEITHPEIEIFARMLPAEEVGGDYYDILTAQDGSLWIGIGDVSGHGVTPGLIMMMAQTIHATIVLNFQRSPSEVVVILNKMLYYNVQQRLHETHHMTFTVVRYLGNGCCEYAGSHDDMLVYRQRQQQCEIIPTRGIHLNLVEDIADTTHNASFQLEVGDILVLYTDGVTESENASHELLSLSGLMQLVQRHADKPTSALRDAILTDVLAWGRNKQDDDMSLMVVRRVR
jgi:two-component system, sensor histidine kinase ChiS